MAACKRRDYYPFGMQMPERSFSAGNGYRYGFNGKEQDKDMHSLTAYDYGFRIYNPAIGKFLSVDPLTKSYPELTPYQFASNSPIQAIDLDGLEQYHYTFSLDAQGKTVLTPMYDGKPQDFEEDKLSLGFGGGVFGIFHTYKTVKNPRLEYVVHHQDTKEYFTEPGSLSKESFTYDESLAFSSYEEAAGVTAYDFKETKEDILVRLDAKNKYNEAFLYAAAAKSVRGRQKPATPTTTNKQSVAANGGNTGAAKSNTTGVTSNIGLDKATSFIRTETIGGNKSARTVSANMTIINNGGSLAPIEVANINNKLYVINGHHRLEAGIRANTSLRYKVLTEAEWKAYGYKSESEITGAAAEASAQKIKLDSRIIKKAATQN